MFRRRLWSLALVWTWLGCGDQPGPPVDLAAVGSVVAIGSGSGGVPPSPPVVAASVAVVASSGPLSIQGWTPVLQLEVGGAGGVELRQLTVRAVGSVDERQLGDLRLIHDVDRDGRDDPGEPTLARAGPFSRDDGRLVLRLPKPWRTSPGRSERLLLSLAMPAYGREAAQRVGATAGLELTGPADVDCTPAATGSFPLRSVRPLRLHDHLLISELVVVPTEGELIELFNPTARDVDLSQVYLSDGGNRVTGLPAGAVGLDRGDFLVRFPPGTRLRPGGVLVVARSGSEFEGHYGRAADFCLVEPTSRTPSLWVGGPGGWASGPARGRPGLNNTGEPVLLLRWDGVSDRIEDVDYVFYGRAHPGGEPLDRTGVAFDGPDGDTVPSAYPPDTPAAAQTSQAIRIGSEGGVRRVGFDEGGEVQGRSGPDETSEPWWATFRAARADPGSP